MSRSLKALILSFSILLLLSFGAAVGYFMVQNGAWVVVRFPAFVPDWGAPLSTVEYETPLSVVMAAGIGIGFVLAMLVFLPSWLRRAWERQRERRFIKGLEGELTDLRNLPVERPAPMEDLPDEDEPGGEGRWRRRRSVLHGRQSSTAAASDDAAFLAEALQEVEQEEERR